MANNKFSSNTPGVRQKFYFQFITTPTADTSGTVLLLHFDNRRYFFGRVAEGTQRACIQRGIGIKKVRNIFLTGPTSWSGMGGLIGMILTMADVQSEEIDPASGKRPKLRIQGGPKLMHSIACARRFVFRTGMPIDVREFNPKVDGFKIPSYVDDNISVWSVPVQRRGRSGASSPRLPNGRSQSPNTVDREQMLRADTVKNMFDSDWRKDRLVESRFDEVKLPALVWTRNTETKELTFVQCSTMADAPNLQPESKVLVRNPWPASLVEELPPVDNIAGSISISYVVKGKPQRGKFLPQKAKELGVKPGPDYALLTAGGSVTLEDGTVITSDMVLGATEPGKGMAIFDLPSDEYIEDLSEKVEALKAEVLEGVETISWILGRGVAFNALFTDLLKSFPSYQHVISSPDIGPDYLALDSAAASLVRLAQIRPECFKIPIHDNINDNAQILLQDSPHIPAERGMIVQVAPKSLLDRNQITPFLDIEETKASYKEILRGLMPVPTEIDEKKGPYDDVQILTLGTGSAVPSKYRNVSGTLVQIPGSGSHLFDCGENTLGMLQRAYTAAELEEVLVDLRMIWISHLHADHHLGTLSVINAKREVMQRLGKTEPKLYVISEPNMADYLNDYCSVQSSDHCQLLGVLNSEITAKNGPSLGNVIQISETSLPVTEFLTTRVSHCHGAQACSVTFSNGFKFSYSGDCRPSAQFAQIGRHSDVLLHEATFDDGLEGDAMAKKHSTTGEALAVAYAMKAKNVVLTHFSQRYQKIPVLNEVKFGDVRFEEGNDAEEAGPIEENLPAQVVDQIPDEPTKIAADGSLSANMDSIATLQKVAKEMNVCVAFDLMFVRVGQIRDMYKYYPAIEKMFEMELEKSDAKREERREINERFQEEKEAKGNKSKAQVTKDKKDKSTEPKEGTLYERINRNKSKASKEANGSVAQSDTHSSTENNTTGGDKGKNSPNKAAVTGVAAAASSPSRMSACAKRRSLRKSQETQNAQNAPAQDLLQPESADIDAKLTRQLSAEPETSDAKRPKLDDEPLRSGAE